jgi:hypothetical protein
MTTALAYGPPALLAALICDASSGGADLIQRIVAGCRYAGFPASKRAGYGGALASLANLALALEVSEGSSAWLHSAMTRTLPSSVQAAGELTFRLPTGSQAPAALSSEWWAAFVSGELASYNIAHGAYSTS